MPKNLDTRDYSFRRDASNFASTVALALVSSALPGDHEVKVERLNPFTGSPINLRSVNAADELALISSPGPTSQDLISRAIEHVRVAAPALGFAPAEVPEFDPDPHVKETSTGGRVVNLQQKYHGIPIFQMERTVAFDNTGAIQNVSGASVGDLGMDLETLPSVSVEDAAIAAANYLASPNERRDAWTKQIVSEPGIDLKDYQPRVLGKTSSPSQSLVLDQGPFGESIPSHLVFFYQGPVTRLGWHFLISMPELTEQYAVIVEADSLTEIKQAPQVLYCQKTSSEMATQVRGNVWTHNPGMNPQRQVVDFPRPLADYPINPTPPNLPNGFPVSWVDSQVTVGNNTIAVLGNTLNSLQGALSNNVLTFDPNQPQGDEQKVLNIFYFCNFMHDFFFMLGFDEASGNFQKINFSGKGTGGDPVLARAHAGKVNGTANMLTLADGTQGLMNMGLVPGINRHTAFDSDVVFHEFTHGVSNRLVGGQLNAQALQQPQSRGMGEGWSDYFALTIQNFFLNTDKTVTGDWVIDNPSGIRLAPYDDNYPGSFGQIGKPGQYDGSDEHAIGEIWCAALMKMNRDMRQALGDKRRGYVFSWQLVVDGFKLTPANPSFLDARDAILHALDAQQQAGAITAAEFTGLRKSAWTAFAKFGMGPKASCVGASLFGTVEDRSLPPGL
jgi:extracellular elastinolytic metalloproteinase